MPLASLEEIRACVGQEIGASSWLMVDQERIDAFAEAKIDKHWTAKLFVNNIFNKLYYDALYQSAAPFVLEAPGRAAYVVLSARY